ncbi:MAG: TetR/AcrR family transcriptional regulator [Pseudomonadota bacterium]|nr:TetR/AcrR family transcriptional regulator [Pseudomonadota bacterium]
MSNPAPTRTRRQKVEEREQAILESARRVFFQKGYEGARMSEIAAGAQIAEGTIYIYYKNKAALMRAISSEFWQSLTADAWAEIEGIDDPYEALHALARFHITSLMAQSDMIDLTHSLRVVSADVGTTTEELKTYVRVFDSLYLKGVDRGELVAHPDLWLVRDVFFGTLDYSARTLRLHDDQNVEPVVANLIDGIWAQYGAAREASRASKDRTPARLIGRLEKAVAKLEQLGDD